MNHFIIIWIYLADLFLITKSFSSSSISTVRHGSCNQNLFNETSRTITEDSFKASSVLNDRPEHKPFQARILSPYASHRSGKAWCPENQATSQPNDYIQVDLNSIHIVNMIYTTGRGEGNFVEYVPNFMIKYQRDINQPWIDYISSDGSSIMPGNKDERTLARVKLNPPIIGRNFRIYPINLEKKSKVCLRFALNGCPFEDSVLAYSMRQGSKNPNGLFGDIDLTDDTYKTLDQGHLYNTLGQLSDNQAVVFDYNIVSKPESAGNALVGWNRKDFNSPDPSLQITFNFEQVRNISSLSIFTINEPRANVRVYSSLKLESSLDGLVFETFAIHQTDDLIVEKISDLSVFDLSKALTRPYPSYIEPGKSKTSSVILTYPFDTPLYAKAIRLSLLFGSGDWLMLSEVYFNTHKIDETDLPNVHEAMRTRPPIIANDPVSLDREQSDLNYNSAPKEDASTNSFDNENAFIYNHDTFKDKQNKLDNYQSSPNVKMTTELPHHQENQPLPPQQINGIEDFIANRPSSFFLIGGSILVAFTLSLIFAFILHFYCHRKRHSLHSGDDDDQLNKNGNIINHPQSYQTLALNHKDSSINDQIQFQFNPYLQSNHHTLGRNNLLINNPCLAQQLLGQSSSIPNSFSNSEETHLSTQMCNTQNSSNSLTSSKNKEDSISPISMSHPDDCLVKNSNRFNIESEGQDYASTSICGLPQSPITGNGNHIMMNDNSTDLHKLQMNPINSDSLLAMNSSGLLNQQTLAGPNAATVAAANLLQMYNQQNFLQQTLQRFPNYPMQTHHQGNVNLGAFSTQSNSNSQNIGDHQISNFNSGPPPPPPISIQQFKSIIDQNQYISTPSQDYYTNQLQFASNGQQFSGMTQIKPPEPPLNHPTSTTNSKRNSVYSVCI